MKKKSGFNRSLHYFKEFLPLGRRGHCCEITKNTKQTMKKKCQKILGVSFFGPRPEKIKKKSARGSQEICFSVRPLKGTGGGPFPWWYSLYAPSVIVHHIVGGNP